MMGQPPLSDDYLARHPEQTLDQVPHTWHTIAITGIDDNGNVQTYNPWGIKRTLTPEQLVQALSSAK